MVHDPLLVIGIDGFRHDRLTAETTPNLWALAHEGAWNPDGMQCQFPAQTSPNFRSIITGLHVQNHGILDNLLQDPVSGEWFDYFGLYFDKTSSLLKPNWYNGKEPIWTTYQNKTGKKAGAVYFPFSNVKTQEASKLYFNQGELPKFHDDAEFLKARIDDLIGWMGDPTDPVGLGLIYFSEPDHSAHTNDYFGTVVTEKLKTVDQHIGHLVKRLKERNFFGKVNILVFADHGMVNARNPEYHVDLVTGLDPSIQEKLMVCTGHPLGLKVRPGVTADIGELYDYFKKFTKGKAVDVYRKGNFPQKYHYAKNTRAGDIILEAHFGHVLLYLPEAIDNANAKKPVYGEHGFKSEITEMRPLFFAHGPAFKSGFESRNNFENVDLYPLMCSLLGMDTPANDGDFEAVRHLLKNGTLDAAWCRF